jgi:hypothetical protein
MMRSVGVTSMASFFLATTCGFAWAGDHHRGARLICSDCHVMHYSQSHGYNASGGGFFVPLGTAGPYTALLRNEINSLCLTCHDNTSIAPDVMGVNTGKSPGDIREAGFLNRLGGTGQPATGHTLGTLATAPGGTWKPEDENGTGIGLNCVNCHQQHGVAEGVTGGNAYRNLRTDPGTAVAPTGYITYAVGGNDLSKDVFERSAARYDESQVDFNEPDNSQSAIGRFCGGCHANFHGTIGSTNIGGTPSGTSATELLRHPVGGVNIGGGPVEEYSSLAQFASRTNRVKVMSQSGVWSPPAADVTPTCISCHKGHGNHNAFGLIYRSGTGTRTEDGDTNGTSVRDLCGQCHVQTQ